LTTRRADIAAGHFADLARLHHEQTGKPVRLAKFTLAEVVAQREGR